jgi:transcriptional regulator with XRE-family HTH domain
MAQAESPIGQVPLRQNIASVVLAAMHLRGLRHRKDLAEILHTDAGTVSKLLNGKQGWTPEQLRAVGEALDIHPGRFFDDPAELLDSRSRCLSLVEDLDDAVSAADQAEPRRRGHLQLV